MTRSAGGALKGSTEPRVSSVPLFHSSAGQDAIDLAASAGLFLDPWQQWVLEHSLGETRAGLWASPEVCLNVPRQCGKGSVLEARELAGLALFGEELVIHTAHEFDTAKEHYLRMESLIRDSYLAEYLVGYRGDPEGKLSGLKSGNSAVEIAFDIPNPLTGKRKRHRLRFKARSKGAGRGFSGDLVVLDEAFALDQLMMDALSPTMGARENPQIWYTSSAGLPDSDVLRGLMERGHKGTDPELFYAEWSVDRDDPRYQEWVEDPENADALPAELIAQANPSMGFRKQWRAVRADQRRMTVDGFSREHLGIWDQITGGNAVPAGAWEDCRDPEWPEAVPLTRVAIGVDVPPDRSSATVAVAGVREGESEVSVELFQQGEGTDWVAPALRELLDARGRVPVLVDGSSAAAALEADFRAHRVRAQFLSTRVYAQACGAFFDAVVNGRLRHHGQRDLDRAVGVAGQSMKGAGLWVWKRPDSTHNIAPLCAATLAVHGCVNRRDSGQSSAGRRRAVVL